MKKIEDIRQSTGWANYLASLGWKAFRTSSGVLTEYMDTPFGEIAKTQRPANITQADVAEIEHKLKNMLLMKLEPYEDADLTGVGFKKSKAPLLPPSTIYIDLENSEEDLRKKLSRSARYSINKAQRDGNEVSIFQEPSNDVLKNFHTLLKETGKRNHFYVQPLSDLLQKRDIFGKEAFLITVRDKEGNLIGCNFYLGYQKTIWALHIATGNFRKASKGGYLLVWHAILYFKKLGYTTMDMEGIHDSRFFNFTKNWEGFSQFKERFGGEIITMPYPQTKIYSSFLKILSGITGINL